MNQLDRFMITVLFLISFLGNTAVALTIESFGWDQATIGGTPVPLTLDCQEDEVIAFVWEDTLRCVHIEEVGRR